MSGLIGKKVQCLFITLTVLIVTASVYASDNKIKFVSVSWTGVTIKTELGVQILNSLGYKASNTMVSVPIVYKALSTNDADIFLGNWMPSMKTIADKYFESGRVINFTDNMPNARYTLAAPSFVVDGGLKTFEDIAKFGEELDYKIYGIEAGNDGNEIIQAMIDKDMYGLKNFELISSSEQAMLLQVKAYAKQKKWIVFLGWAPHYMNEMLDMKYLDGSTADTFGENNGTATVFTNIRKGFDTENPNVATFLKNFKFPIYLINQIMTEMHKDTDKKVEEVSLAWVKKHPELYKSWLKDVKTIDGKPAVAAFEKFLKI
jgi:glycine betaine/proline transport system substrate-binding protein